MEQKIFAFMKENGIAVFAEADQATGAGVHEVGQGAGSESAHALFMSKTGSHTCYCIDTLAISLIPD